MSGRNRKVPLTGWIIIVVLFLVSIEVLFRVGFLIPIIIGLVVLLVPFYGGTRTGVNAEGQTVLGYGRFPRIISSTVAAVLFVVLAAAVLNIPYVDTPLVILFSAVVASLVFGLALGYNLTWYGLDDTGIELHRPFRRTLRIAWDRVESVRLVAWGFGIGITGDGKNIGLANLIDGLPALAKILGNTSSGRRGRPSKAG